MSGIAGVLIKIGSSADSTTLGALVAGIAGRGPDGEGHVLLSQVALAWSGLETTWLSNGERQPLSLDGHAWIVADARLDDRGHLIDALRNHGESPRTDATDTELILHAYRTWGADLAVHLHGDFAFAIWDSPQKRLVLCRDRFGVKPLFFAETNLQLAFSNTFPALHAHMGKPEELDHDSIIDFLMFGFSTDYARTGFAGIKRLPPAHRLILQDGRSRIDRYWEPGSQRDIRYSRPGDYIEHFSELFTSAVRDRLQHDAAGIELSGGLDSGAIAVYAAKLRNENAGAKRLRAFNNFFAHLIPDDERRFSLMTAKAAGIEIEHIAQDDRTPFDTRCIPFSPEPFDNVFVGSPLLTLASVSRDSRILLSGQGADEVLAAEAFPSVWRNTRPGHFLHDVIVTTIYARKRPPLGLRRFPGLSRPSSPPLFETGLDSVSSLGRCPSEAIAIRDHWQSFWIRNKMRDPGARRSMATHLLSENNYWAPYLESYDPGVTGINVESRWPFLDSRLVETLLGFPPYPWTMDKFLLRKLLADKLPHAIVRRPKSPLSADPQQTAATGELVSRQLRERAWHELTLKHVPASAFRDDFPESAALSSWQLRVRLLVLDNWISRWFSAHRGSK